jgi:hypothetical protein
MSWVALLLRGSYLEWEEWTNIIVNYQEKTSRVRVSKEYSVFLEFLAEFRKILF